MVTLRQCAIWMGMLISAGCVYRANAVNEVPSTARSTLDGTWEFCLRLGEAGFQRPRAEAAVGYLSLMHLVERPRAWMYLGEPTHHGIYTLDLSILGIERDPRNPIPLIGARPSGDSVHLVLDPFGSHGPTVLSGQMISDSISGSWYHHAYAGGATGTFMMKKLEEDRLPVPYSIRGPIASPSIAGCG